MALGVFGRTRKVAKEVDLSRRHWNRILAIPRKNLAHRMDERYCNGFRNRPKEFELHSRSHVFGGVDIPFVSEEELIKVGKILLMSATE